jgi:hypothetical protein
MHPIVEKLLALEAKTRLLHQKLYAVQELRLDLVIDLALLKLEFRADENLTLDFDLIEAQLLILNNEIGTTTVEINQVNYEIEHNIFQIEYL